MSSTISPREELLKIQKRIFARNNAFIRSQARVSERGFDLYEGRYKRRVRNYQKVVGQEDLIAAILSSDVIYLGDYHTNEQSQRSLLRILKLVIEQVPSLGLGLELVQKKHQKFLDDFIAEKISEEIFLEKIQFKKYWYFDLWQNFKPIFDFARFHKLPLFAIESSLSGNATVEKRDEKNAALIASLLSKNPNMKLVVFVGDLHIAPSHLPRQVSLSLKEKNLKKKSLVIYQNSESIYWKLAEKEIEHQAEIVQISKNEFCVTNTPPIVWQQSFLNWLEHEGESIDFLDARHSFLELLKHQAEFLSLELPSNAEEVEVFTCGDLSFLKRLSEDPDFSKRDIERIKKQILASESYCIPQKRYVYLANLSLNHAAEESAHYLKNLCSGPEEPRDLVDAFYANTLHEALGFFGSKIINHKRKCFHEMEYQNLLRYLKSSQFPRQRMLEFEIAQYVLKHKKMEKKGIPIRHSEDCVKRHILFFGVTHALGYMMGDRLYYALLEEKITKDEIRDLFRDPMKEEGRPFEIYKKLLWKLRGVKIPRRV